MKAEKEKIEKNIAECDQQLFMLDQREKESAYFSLYQALVKLNYEEQRRVMNQFLKKARVGAFYIHGRDRFGKRWLVNRFIKKHLADECKEYEVISTYRDTEYAKSNAPSWQRKLEEKYATATVLSDLYPLEAQIEISKMRKLVEFFLDLAKTKTIIFVFRIEKEMEDYEVEQILTEFWRPLVREVETYLLKEKGNWLWMFLTDERDETSPRQLSFATESDSGVWDMMQPVKLPFIQPFSDLDITDWLARTEEKFLDRFDELVTNTHSNIQFILEKSDCVPRDAMIEVCRICNIADGESWLKQWMKY